MPNPRVLLTCAVLLTALLVEVTVLSRLPLPGATPDLVLVCLAALALQWGPTFGAAAGFAAGLGLDVVPPADGALGHWALTLCLAGYLVGLFEGAAESSVLLPVAVVALAAAVAGVLHGLIAFAVGDPRASWSLVVRMLPTAVLYDVILSPFVVSAVLGLARRVVPEPSRW